MTVPAVQRDLTPFTDEQHVRFWLKRLFAAWSNQTPRTEEEARFRLADYLEAVSPYPGWAIEAAVKKFLDGKVPGHNVEWLPNRVQLRRACEAETEWHCRMAERQEPRPMLTDQRVTEISEEKREQNYHRLKALAEMLGGGTETRDDKLAALEIVQAAPVRKELVEALERQRRPE